LISEDGAAQYALEDVDGDGDVDLTAEISVGDLNLDLGISEGTVTGNTYDGRRFIGSDTP
jgi:hypothetical protein